MKKAFVLVALWLCVLSGGVAAGTAEGVAYTIHFDRDTKETYPLQEQLQETYEQLMRGIQKDSRYTVLVHNLSLFESDDVQAKMEQDRLVLTQGDGRGASVSARWRTGAIAWRRWSRSHGWNRCFPVCGKAGENGHAPFSSFLLSK